MNNLREGSESFFFYPRLGLDVSKDVSGFAGGAEDQNKFKCVAPDVNIQH